MRPWLPALFALSAALPGSAQELEPKKKVAATSLLPEGSQLHGVVIPRHNKQRKLVNSLMADVVTLVNDEIIAGSRVTIDFYDRRGKRNARIKLQEATFRQSIGMLHATEAVTLDAETYKARGQGLHYAMKSGRGLLTGPAVTWMHNPPETAMKSKTPSLIGAAGIALVAQTGSVSQAQEPETPQPVRINTVTKDPIGEARLEAQQQLGETVDATSSSDAEVKEFVETIPLDYEKLTGSKPTAPPAEPLDFEPGPDHTVITCDGGMYFDSDKGVLVYMKNVRVTDPRYILTGADVLRIYMGRKAAPKPTPDGESGATQDKSADKGPVPTMGGNFDSVEKIVATGAVRILQKSVQQGKQPVEASGALFTYNPETGDILLSGGYPWVKQGDFFARAKQPDLSLRMKRNGDFVTEGSWEMGGRLNQDKKNR